MGDISPASVSCNLHAFDGEQERRYRALKQTLQAAVQQVRETENGFALVFPADASVCLAAMEFATLERLCCSFLTFQLELSPERGPFTLTLGGPPGTKEILAEALIAAP